MQCHQMAAMHEDIEVDIIAFFQAAAVEGAKADGPAFFPSGAIRAGHGLEYGLPGIGAGMAAMVSQGVDHDGQIVGVPAIVGIEIGNDLTRCPVQPSVAGGGYAFVTGV